MDSEETLPFISVVMPVRNEAACIATLIERVLQQDYPPMRFEVLVCDGMSGDGTPEIVRGIQDTKGESVRLVENPGRLSSAGRNCGVRASCGEIVVFLDGHCEVPGDTMLTDIARLFATTEADVLCRPQPLRANITTAVQKAICAARASVLGHGSDSTIFALTQRAYIAPDSSGAIYRRRVFDTVGMYDESFDACEDVEFNVRCRKAGLRAYTSPELTVNYEPRRSLGALWKQMVRYGRGRTRLYRKHPDSLTVPALAPAAMLLSLLALTLLSLLSRSAGVVMIAIVTAYLVAELVCAVPRITKDGWRAAGLMMLVFPCIHLGLGWGLVREWLFPRQQVAAQAAERAARAA